MTLKSMAAYVKPTGWLIHSRPQKAADHRLRCIALPDQCPELALLIAANCSGVAVP